MKKRRVKKAMGRTSTSGVGGHGNDGSGSDGGEITPLSMIKSGLKYSYILALFVLLSGVFHPLINNGSFDRVALGTLVLILGLAGGILLYKGAGSDGYRHVFLGIGFALVGLSLYLIFVLAGKL